MQSVGKKIARVEGISKVTGCYTYAADISLPRMLYGKIKRSEYPHARIIHIDTTKAKEINGVIAAITGEDLPYYHGSAIIDEPFLAREKVRYIGEPVAAVSAISEDIASEAVDMIEIEYEELESVFDVEISMQKEAPLVHPDLDKYTVEAIFQPVPNSNICSFFKLEKGDVKTGFDQSYEIFENNFRTQPVEQCPLETHAAIAQIDMSGKITIWTTSQAPFIAKRELAEALGIPLNNIRIIINGVGGGFGSKTHPRIEPVAIGLALHSKNRPVKMVLTREEEFKASAHKHHARIYMKTGVTKDGIILARQVKAIYDTGAYAESGPLVVRNSGFTAAGPYNIRDALIESYCVYTNNPISGMFRGFGTPQLTWAYESQMDIIADKLDIDPLEIRLKNCLKEGDEIPSGEILKSVGLRQTLEKVAKEIGWREFEKKEGYGIGIACAHKLTFSPATSSAFIRIDEDGSVTIISATVELGQGSNTVLCQIASESLGIPIDLIRISPPDTDYSPYDQSTTGSRSTFNMGNAIIRACDDGKEKLLKIASRYYNLPEDKLIFNDGKIKPAGSDEQGLTYSELIRWNFKPRKASLIGEGMYTSERVVLADVKTGKSPRVSAFWIYGTQAVVLKVDSETGQVEIIKVTAAYDVGKAINPLGVEGQIEGGVAQGLGSVLFEELKIHEGKVLNPSLRDYKIFTASDIPQITPIIVEALHDEGPFNAKGIGELVLNPTAPAVASAIHNATGIWIFDLPLNQEKIFKEINKKRPLKKS